MIEVTNHSLNIKMGRLNINGGWYHGEQFKLFSLTVLEMNDGWFTVLNLSVAKFDIGILVY